MRPDIKEYWAELTFLFIGIVGLLLLIGGVNVRAILSGIGRSLVKGLRVIGGILAEFSSAEFFGIVLVLIVGALFAWRACRRFVRSERYPADECPKCGNLLKRVRRVRWDRIFSKVLFMPLHRYRCADPDCGWIGVRQPGRHQRNSED